MRKKDLKGDLNLLQFPSHYAYVLKERKNDFPYHGVYCFCGWQGSGKTISAVRLIANILADYPDTYLITNVHLNFDFLNHIKKENVIDFERYYQLFMYYDKPTIFLIDEAHLLFNSLNSKQTDLNLFQVISQNRKCRRVFILTSQVFSRLEKVMREQINTVIACNTYFHYFTRCLVIGDFKKVGDDLVGKRQFCTWWSHDRNIHYKMYDTYQILDFSSESPFWNKQADDIKNNIIIFNGRKEVVSNDKVQKSNVIPVLSSLS